VTACITDTQGIHVPAPRLSVVVVSFNAPRLLEQCLEAMAVQSRERDVEIVVVMDAGRAGAYSRVKERFARVCWMDAPPSSTVPQMRSLGMQRCRGDIVALLEDDCVVGPAWCDAVMAAHRTEDVAIGGAVEPGTYRRAIDWAVYFCEYGRFMLPLRPQPSMALALAGDHVTYKRPVLRQMLPNPGEGFQDFLVHSAWADASMPMRTEETLVVRNVNSWSLRHVTSVPYHHGRAFAGQRFAGRPAWFRAATGCLAAALPLLKIGRVIGDTVARRRFIGRLVQALPWMVVFMTSWSLGEAVGCVRGPGASASRWR
jgi:glycosyltransferase involved in cell wall biosynthesis